jgi:hypothetical protein
MDSTFRCGLCMFNADDCDVHSRAEKRAQGRNPLLAFMRGQDEHHRRHQTCGGEERAGPFGLLHAAPPTHTGRLRSEKQLGRLLRFSSRRWRRNRTFDTQITSLLLYQLSYPNVEMIGVEPIPSAGKADALPLSYIPNPRSRFKAQTHACSENGAPDKHQTCAVRAQDV